MLAGKTALAEAFALSRPAGSSGVRRSTLAYAGAEGGSAPGYKVWSPRLFFFLSLFACSHNSPSFLPLLLHHPVHRPLLSLLLRHLHVQATTAVEILQRTMVLTHSQVQFQLWDVPASPWLHPFLPSYLTDATEVLLMYSVRDRSSFDAVDAWAARVHSGRAAQPSSPLKDSAVRLRLVGTHADCRAHCAGGAVTEEEAAAKAQALGLASSVQLNACDARQVTEALFGAGYDQDLRDWAAEDGDGDDELPPSAAQAPAPTVIVQAPAAGQAASTGCWLGCCNAGSAATRVVKSALAWLSGGANRAHANSVVNGDGQTAVVSHAPPPPSLERESRVSAYWPVMPPEAESRL